MKNRNILLAMLPYWSPVIPPAGLSALKSYLQPHGFNIRAIDFNNKTEALTFYYDYFRAIRSCIPEEKRGTFYNMGHEVLEKHLMAFQKYTDEKRYFKLVKLLIAKTYYVDVDDSLVKKVDGYIRKYLEQLRKYCVYLLDCEKPAVVGITLYKTTLPLSLYLLKFVKKYDPNIKTVVGGGLFADSHKMGTPNFSALLEETKEYVDKIIIGDGEVLFLKYLSGEFSDDRRVLTRQDLQPHEVLSLEDFPLPDFTDFSMKKYSHLVATGSKGCPFDCSFCNEKGFFGKFRKRDQANTVRDMMALHESYHHKLFFMTDSLLNPVVDELASEIIKNRAPVYMDTYFRIDRPSADLERVLHWRRGGLYRVRIGVESGADRMLEQMNKGITVDQVRAALPNLATAGIKTTTYWVMGHPHETEADFQQTLDLVEEMKDSIWQAECNAFRYYWDAHNADDEWKHHRRPLYPEEMEEMLVFKYYTLDIEPDREEGYNRVFRFINHCKKLGIPNPYSGYEGFEADKRWKELHKNAVPSVEECEDINLCDMGKSVSLAAKPGDVEADFNF